MGLYLGSQKTSKLYLGSQKGKALYRGSNKVWSGASAVTYTLESNVSYTEEVDEGASVLSPSSFTPMKSGYTFLGWREDTSASSDVLTTKTATGEPMHLYAVFQKAVVLTTYNGSNSASSSTKYALYNNGHTSNPSFTLSENALTGWNKSGWTTSASGYSATVADGGSVTLSANATYYSLYQQTITVTYYNNSSNASSTSGTRTANIHSATTYSNPSFSLTVATVSGWSIRGWSTSSSASGAISYNSGSTFTRDSNITLYASWSTTVTVTYYNNSSTASSTSGTRYRNYAGTVTNPSFTLNVASVSGWSARGWSTSNGASASISYSSGVAFTRDSNVTLYASWSRTVTVSYNGNGQTSGSTSASTGTAYRNYAGTASAASIALRANGFAKTSYTFYRWALNSASGTQYKAGASISSSTDVTMYANWLVTETSFNYTGGVQSFTMLAGVTYLLQVYGAQGGSVSRVYQTAAGGKGAYAYGYKSYSSNTTVYICVGGKGATASSGAVAGGYNGGGSSYVSDHAGGGGGGATHIGLSNAILKNTASSNVLIVAGGGGGAGGNQNYGSGAVAAGGGGGGTNGDAGARTINWSDGTCTAGAGGSQSGAGSGSDYQTAGGYGQGASYNPTYYTLAGGAGGGGWYGGGMGYGSQYEDEVNAAGGGGGSGYIGGVSNGGFLNGYWPDNGFAKITVTTV